jgi:uncharacterized membrane protein (DUF485 family)
MAANAKGFMDQVSSGTSNLSGATGDRCLDPIAQIAQIEANPLFQQLVIERTRLGRTLSIVMATAYFSFILCVAFVPGTLGTPLSTSTVVTWGILVGLGLIGLGFLLTAAYVFRANSRFDHLSEKLLENLK